MKSSHLLRPNEMFAEYPVVAPNGGSRCPVAVQKRLLIPDEVDEWTGYRYYSIEQMQKMI